MSVGPFSTESNATQTTTTVSDQGQANQKSTVFQGNAKGASGKNNKFAEAGGVAGDLNTGLNLNGYKGKGDLTVNYTSTTTNPAPAAAPIPPATPFTPPPAPVTPPAPGDQSNENKGLLERLQGLLEKKNADGTTSINYAFVFTVLGSIIAIGFGVKLLKGK